MLFLLPITILTHGIACYCQARVWAYLATLSLSSLLSSFRAELTHSLFVSLHFSPPTVTQQSQHSWSKIHCIHFVSDNWDSGRFQSNDQLAFLLNNCQAQAQTQALRHLGTQPLRLTQANSGSLRLLLSDSDSDPEPGLTLKSCRPPTHPPTFKHEGRVPHKNPKSKTDLE